MSDCYYLINYKSGRYIWIGQSPCSTPERFYLYHEPGADEFLMEAFREEATLAVVRSIEQTPEEGYYEIEWVDGKFVVNENAVLEWPDCFEEINSKWERELPRPTSYALKRFGR